MSILSGVDLDGYYLEYGWYTDMLSWFAEDAKTRGIDIPVGRGKNYKQHGVLAEPDIYCSGFYSQGDGLAFACDINWPVFFDAHEDVKTSFTTEYLLLVANPSYIRMWMKRSGRHGNQMSVESEDDYPDCVECGFFAGEDMTDDVPDLDIAGLEKYVEAVCEAEATRMYKELREAYEHQQDCEQERKIEEAIKENKEELHKVICWLLLQGATFSTHELYLDDVSEDICFSDLTDLGLTKHINGTNWRVTLKGLELLKGELE